MVSLESIRKRRNERIDLEGTPPAIFLNDGDIAVDTSSGGWVIDFREETKTRKHIPFSVIQITNNSGSDLNIYPNQVRSWQKVVRLGTIVSIRDFKGISSIRLSKRDAAITISAGEVEVNVEREPLSDDEFRRRQFRKKSGLTVFEKIIRASRLGG